VQRADGDRYSGKSLIGRFLGLYLIKDFTTYLRCALMDCKNSYQNKIIFKQKKYLYLLKGLGASTGTDYKVTMNGRHSFITNPPLQAGVDVGVIKGTIIIVLLTKFSSLL
jgi:hypothetical protein